MVEMIRGGVVPPARGETVNLVMGPQPRLDDEISILLRSRLRGAAFIFLGFWSIWLSETFLFAAYQTTWNNRLVHIGLLTLIVVLLLLLYSRLPLSLAKLRAMELILFGTSVVYLARENYLWLQSDWFEGATLPGQEWKLLHLTVHDLRYNWFVILVLYGILIPNTLRRSIIVLSALVSCPLLVLAALLAKDPEWWDRRLHEGIFHMLVSMTLGVSISAFGAHRFSSLQRAAFEARLLGQYFLDRLLGVGGMGEVYLARHQLLQRPSAIKLIRPERAGSAALLRFEREAQAMAGLTHPNTVAVYDYGRVPDGTFYYVMEYLPGLNLEEITDKYGPLPAARLVHLLRQVCGALCEAHARGLIHRDLKPSNIIICERGGVHDVVKLVDYGLVFPTKLDGSFEGRLTKQGTIVGTPPFMSPEQIGGEVIDPRSDLYSLGATAYYALTGHAPFERDSLREIFKAHLHEPVTPPTELNPTVPDDMEAILLRCLAKSPAERFPDATSLEQTLANCSCNGQWDQYQAREWWREHVHQKP